VHVQQNSKYHSQTHVSEPHWKGNKNGRVYSVEKWRILCDSLSRLPHSPVVSVPVYCSGSSGFHSYFYH